MRALLVLNEFPALSETFALDQITGLLDRGVAVNIIATRPRREQGAHEEIKAYDLLSKVRYLSPDGDSRILKILREAGRQAVRGRFRLLGRMGALAGRRFLGRRSVNGLSHLLGLAAVLEQCPTPDIIYCYFGPNGDAMVRLRACLGLDAPIVTMFLGNDLSSVVKAHGPEVYRELARSGDAFLPVSDYFSKALVGLGFPAKRIMVHRMGINPQRLQQDRLSETGEERAANRYIFLSIGRMVEKKGHAFAIRAFADCVKANPDNDVQFILIGDGPLRKEMTELVASLKIKDKVSFLGALPRNDVLKWLGKADAFVLPSVTASDGDMEGVPVSIAEAMAAGLPVLSTFHSGIPELVIDGESGVLTPERDVDALARAMSTFVRDPNSARKMGKAGQEFVIRTLNIETLNDLLVERLRRIARVDT